jgi:hypothetical protein
MENFTRNLMSFITGFNWNLMDFGEKIQLNLNGCELKLADTGMEMMKIAKRLDLI